MSTTVTMRRTSSVRSFESLETMPPATWFAPIAGIRGLAHLTIIALHSAMITTSSLPSKGSTWDTFRTSPIFTTMLLGGFATDVFFVISGFLLAISLLRAKPSATGVVSFVLKRVKRLYPSMFLALGIDYSLGGSWSFSYDIGVPYLHRVLSVLLFFQNYTDISTWGTYGLGPCWSNSVEVHCSIALFLVTSIVRSAKKLRTISILAIALSLLIRSLLFEKDTTNITLLSKYIHYGDYQTPGSMRYLSEKYPHKWLMSPSLEAVSYNHNYFNKMYSPTHARFGPYAIGVLMACNFLLAPTSAGKRVGSSAALILTALACLQLSLPIIPPDDSNPPPLEAQFFLTIALRLMISASAGFLLYRAVLPPEHGLSSPILRWLLSAPFLRFVGGVSYPSFMIHFRILEWLHFKQVIQQPDEGASGYVWLAYATNLFITGGTISLTLAAAFNWLVERPTTKKSKTN